MNIVLFEPSEIVGNRAVTCDERAKHIAKVLRASTGDSVRVGIVNGLMGYGTITKINRRPPYLVELAVSIDDVPPSPSDVDVVLALPRPIMFKRILSQATTLGVKKFHIINAGRVEKSFWDASVIAESVYRTHLLKGLEQAVDTRLPCVFMHRSFNTFLDSIVPELKREYAFLLVADPAFPRLTPSQTVKGMERILLAVGPEGGWLDYEITKMVDSGFKGFGIGNRILRVDTAVIGLHSMLTGGRC
jgi:RsmE family RNA methyltransferase